MGPALKASRGGGSGRGEVRDPTLVAQDPTRCKRGMYSLQNVDIPRHDNNRGEGGGGAGFPEVADQLQQHR